MKYTKVLVYKLENNSACQGVYLYKGEHHFLEAGESLILDIKPTNVTANIRIKQFRKKVPVQQQVKTETTKTTTEAK